jgi:hypothetical protein
MPLIFGKGRRGAGFAKVKGSVHVEGGFVRNEAVGRKMGY